MGYQIELDEDVRSAIARCSTEQLDRAVQELSEGTGEDPVKAVHSARKAIKKERSLLRLVRGAVPAKQRRRENTALREAARGLSDARDAEVMIDTLDDLSERYVGQVPEAAFDAIRPQLEQTRDERRAHLLASALGNRAVQELGTVKARSETWKLNGDGWEALAGGLTRAYADGRSAFARARTDRTSETWHAWRKRVKDLWYQERLLAGVCGPATRGQAKDAGDLSDLLGDDHDLGVLRAALVEGRVRAPADLDAIVALIDHRRRELQAEALHLGGRIYAEKPKAFVRRMERAWAAGRARAAAQSEDHPSELAAATRVPHPA